MLYDAMKWKVACGCREISMENVRSRNRAIRRKYNG